MTEKDQQPTAEQPVDPAAKRPRPRTERKFPALTFEEALPLAEAIQKYAAGQKVRRLTLFEKLNKSPDSGPSRQLISSSGQYGLTKGGYGAEFLELTQEGQKASSDDVGPAEKLLVRFSLAISQIAPFKHLYSLLNGSKVPAKEVMADNLGELVPQEHKDECVDTFILNAKFVGLLRTIAGAERIVSIEQVIESLPKEEGTFVLPGMGQSKPEGSGGTPAVDSAAEASTDFRDICFYITPIGELDSQERKHADFMMEFVIKPALHEVNLTVVRADQMGQPGMIGRQVVENILKARLVIADLSFHNPNVFYELCLRHTTRLPTVQIKRTIDRLPFDLNQSRTISIDTSDVYGLYAKLQTHISEVATQVRRSLQDTESGDNPISLYYPKAKLTWN